MATEDFIVGVAGADYEQSFQSVKPEALALDENARIAVNTDIPSVLLLAIGVMAKVEPHISAIKALPEYDFRHIIAFRERTLALHSVQAKYTHALAPQEQLPILLAEATKRRDVFLGDCSALIAHGVLNRECIAQYKGQNGYKNVAFDLTGLVELLTETWPQIEGKTLITKADLEEARQFALRFVEAVAYREQAPDKVASLADLRQRIYTLFVLSYDQLRRAIIFLRWDHGDADTIAPSLFAGRGGRKPASSDVAQATTTALPASPVTAPATTVTAEGTAAAKLPVGHPDSLPFATA